MFLSAMLLTSSQFVKAQEEPIIIKSLSGIGYREQELQVPKVKHFLSDDPTGVDLASMAGGTNIFIQGTGFNFAPEANLIKLESLTLKKKFFGPQLTEDDIFNSHPSQGTISYRFPSLTTLFDGIPMELFKTIASFPFYISIVNLGTNTELQCAVASNCLITLRKSYTPNLHFISPRVTYLDSEADVHYSYEGFQSQLEDIQGGEWPFISAKIGNQLIDFSKDDDQKEAPICIPSTKCNVRGRIGETIINKYQDLKMHFSTGLAQVQDAEAEFCDTSKVHCYKAKSVPVIFDISNNEGLISGGQNITFKGHGFDQGEISAIVDGQPCAVTSQSKIGFSCKTGQKSEISDLSKNIHIGQHGVTRETITNTIGKNLTLTLDNIEDARPQMKKKLSIDFEVGINTSEEKGIGNILKSWFTPPADAQYRFYMACTDHCVSKIALTPDTITDLTTLLTHNTVGKEYDYINTNSSRAFRSFFEFRSADDGKSEWFQLSKGQNYYLEAKHLSYAGSEDHFSLGVEIKEEGQVYTGHPNAMREVQEFEIYPEDPTTIRLETMKIIVNDISEDEYKLSFNEFIFPSSPRAGEIHYIQSLNIPGKATARQMKASIQNFWAQLRQSTILVKRDQYDADNNIIEDIAGEETSANAVKLEYTIKAEKLYYPYMGPPTKEIIISKMNSTANITIELPVMGSRAMSSQVDVECIDSKGENGGLPITIRCAQTNSASVLSQMLSKCSNFVDEVDYVPSPENPKYNQNGFRTRFRFSRYNAKPGQWTVKPTPEDTWGARQHNRYATIHNYAESLFYGPIPFEFLRTFEEKPQIIVTVGDEPAVCHNMTCDYIYKVEESLITEISYDKTLSKLEIKGQLLLLENSTISFGQSECVIDKSSWTNTLVECVMKEDPVCGLHYPQFQHPKGTINVESSVPKQQIDCELTEISSEHINVQGGDIITISGKHFPHQADKGLVDIEFSSDPPKKCEMATSSLTVITCLSPQFLVSEKGKEFTLKITINSVEQANSFTQTIKTRDYLVTQMEPMTASPVLKRQIVITIESDFPEVLAKEDFAVSATLKTLSDSVKPKLPMPYNMRVKGMNVVHVNQTEKTITVMFGGAYSGQYSVQVKHNKLGVLNTQSIDFEVGSKITSISPISGSIYGGSLLTLKGTNWDTSNIQNNPVQINFGGITSAIDCFVQSTSEDEIKCRLADLTTETSKEANSQGTVIVFLKSSEEAVCDLQECKFLFVDVVPTIETVEKEWDSINNYWKIKVSGTSFTGSADTTQLFVNGQLQTTLESVSTHAIFHISNVTSGSLKNMKMYFDVGAPKGSELLDQVIELEPKLVSVYPNIGSTGGSTIMMNIQGWGTASLTSDFNAQVQVRDNGLKGICAQVTVKAYGKIECVTRRFDFERTEMTFQHKTDELLTFKCANLDETKCFYEQSWETNMTPVLTTATLTDQITITIEGKNLNKYASEFTHQMTFQGIAADTFTITDDTSAVGTWAKGVPITTVAEKPEIIYTIIADPSSETDSRLIHLAHPQQENTDILNPIGDGLTSSEGLSCSFAGGCLYEIIGRNSLGSLLKSDPENHSIKVCNQVCEYSEEDSTTNVACKIPSISTTYSNSNFQISTPSENLNSGKYFGSSPDGKFDQVFDGNILTSTGTFENYFSIGMSFKDGHVGQLSQVKFFLTNPSVWFARLEFEGSNDKISWTKLFKPFEDQKNVRSGWITHDWKNSSEYPAFQHYQFTARSNVPNWIQIMDIKFTGVEVIQDNNLDYMCDVKLVSDGVEIPLPNQVKYEGAITPVLTSIEPRFGRVVGGTSVTFTGTKFSPIPEENEIIIDGIPCIVTASTSTEIVCTTGKRPGLIPTSLLITVKNQGRVSLQGNVFTYVNAWSDDSTWGYEFAPIEGESIYIPAGLNLLVDVDRTDVLNAIIVEGSLIFAPEADKTHHRYFDARYIFIRNGTMEVGTEEHPYDSKITITMHGTASESYLPIYGNKVIACRYCQLDMHGPKREPTWTVMEQTAQAGENTITLQRSVDWQVGEMIAIASTDFEGRNAEKREIISIDNSNSEKPVLTLDKPLEFKHYAATETYGTDTIDMRAEVGLLSRHIRFRGDPETSGENQYGATMFLHSQGDDSLVAKIENIEMTDVGQAFKLGRYALHFHMIGAVHKSYVKGNSIHQSNNRAFTIHGTHYLRIENNVAYKVKGHTIFIEDAVETKNIITGNLIMNTEQSMSLLNTDQSPASFWLTHPDNDLNDNHAAGSDRYSYWYDLQEKSMGPSAHLNVCSINDKVGQFNNNHAHSNGRYGLRIFHRMVPQTYPCLPIVVDTTKEDIYEANKPLTANFNNLTSWKNGRTGVIAEHIGDVRFNNFKLADNMRSGAEVLTSQYYGDDGREGAGLYNALIIGLSANSAEHQLEYNEEERNTFGITFPQSDNLQVKGVKFYNFNWANASPIGTCSKCERGSSTDSGARHTTVSGLEFTDCDRKIIYNFPYRAIIQDKDGSLTGKGPDSWATPSRNKHNQQPECTIDLPIYDGVTCDSTIQVRRIAFHEITGENQYEGQWLKILKNDDEIYAGMSEEEKASYIQNTDNWSSIEYKPDKDPRGWAVPFVTGHKYRFHVGVGLDFEGIHITQSHNWRLTDKAIHLTHNFTGLNDGYTIKYHNTLLENQSIPLNANNYSEYSTGQNFVQRNEDLENLEGENILELVIGGKGINQYSRYNTLVIATTDCTGSKCAIPITIADDVETESFVRYWSNPQHWPNGTIPVEGDEVTIEAAWKMEMDVPVTPIFSIVKIEGTLFFKEDIDLEFNAKHIYVKGQLLIGSKEKPYEKNCKINLHGSKEQESIRYDGSLVSGNKVIVNQNTVRIFGKQRKQKMTRLLAPAEKDDLFITVEKGLDLVEGDRLGIAPTSFDGMAVDDVVVNAYNSTTGIAAVQRVRNNESQGSFGLEYYHWGSEFSTAKDYNGVDMRAEVLLLSRNIQITGNSGNNSLGAYMVTKDFTSISDDGTIITRTGSTIIDSVEFFNCSQLDSQNAAVFWDSAGINHSSLTNSSLHNGLGWGISTLQSKNVFFEDNVLFGFAAIGVNIRKSSNITSHRNVISYIHPRFTVFDNKEDTISGFFLPIEAGLIVCVYDKGDQCKDINIASNIVAGATYTGMVIYGHECGASSTYKSKGNVVHSINDFHQGGVGIITLPDKSSSTQAKTCFEGSSQIAYKVVKDGNIYMSGGPKHHIFTNMTSIDNGRGVSLQVNGNEHQNTKTVAEINDCKLYGYSPAPDCPPGGGYCTKIGKCGIPASIFSLGPKDLFPEGSGRPYNTLNGAAAPFDGITYLNRNEFINFENPSAENRPNTAICQTDQGQDYVVPHIFKNSKFNNVKKDALVRIPVAAGAQLDNCGNFPCSGLLNVIYSFEGTQYHANQVDLNFGSSFQVISNNPGFSQYQKSCKLHEKMNAYICQQDTIAQLLFESLDEDKWDRMVSPIFYQQTGSSINNKLNTFMDGGWDGFYTSQKRLSRFPGLIDTSETATYVVKMLGTPPNKMNFRIASIGKPVGIIVQIPYSGAVSRSVEKGGKIIDQNPWNDTTRAYGVIERKFCGENRFVGVKNILEFYLDTTCELKISPRDAIQSLVRMEWSIDKFFEGGGTISFMDKIAGSLGIHASSVKIVSVYEGSLVVNYEISDPNNDPVALAAVQATQTNQFATGTMNLGAPILDVQVQVSSSSEPSVPSASSSGVSSSGPVSIVTGGVVSAPGYTPIVITKVTASSYSNGAASGFNSFVAAPVAPTVVASQQVDSNLGGYGASQIGIVSSGASKFNPTVKIVMNKQTPKPVVGQKSDIGEDAGTASQMDLIDSTLEDDESIKGSIKIIMIAALVVLFIVIALIVTKLMLANTNKAIIEQMKFRNDKIESIKVAHHEPEYAQIKQGSQRKDVDSVDQSIDIDMKFPRVVQHHDEDFNEQYDAKHDFAMFEVSSKQFGGVMNLQEKQNIENLDLEVDVEGKSQNGEAIDTNKQVCHDDKYVKEIEDEIELKISKYFGQANKVQSSDLPEDQEMQSDEDSQ